MSVYGAAVHAPGAGEGGSAGPVRTAVAIEDSTRQFMADHPGFETHNRLHAFPASALRASLVEVHGCTSRIRLKAFWRAHLCRGE
jgi:hypothetical protein